MFAYASCVDVLVQSLWNHRRFLSQWWIQRLLTVEETCPSTISQVDQFVTQETYLLSECLNNPADEFDESRVQAELSALYILWISKATTAPFTQLACLASAVHLLV